MAAASLFNQGYINQAKLLDAHIVESNPVILRNTASKALEADFPVGYCRAEISIINDQVSINIGGDVAFLFSHYLDLEAFTVSIDCPGCHSFTPFL